MVILKVFCSPLLLVSCALNTKKLSHSQLMQVFYFLTIHDCHGAINYEDEDFLERFSKKWQFTLNKTKSYKSQEKLKRYHLGNHSFSKIGYFEYTYNM